MTRDRALDVAIVASAALAIAAGIGALPAAMVFVFKPLTTVLVIAWAWPRGGATPVARRWVRTGLVLSLVGDVALMWPREGFLPGLVAFLLAHLSYLVAFTREQRFAARLVPFIAYGVVAGVILAWLWPGVPPALRVPVVAYVLCLVSMAAQAAVLWRAQPYSARHRGLALGGALFVASDTLLAVNRFAMPLPLASLGILATYWAAQRLIAGWLEGPRPPDG